MTNLIQIAKAVTDNPAFETKDISGDGIKETFCNWGLRLIAEAVFGFSGFNGLNANSIHAFLKANWKRVGPKEAHELAKDKFVVAAWTNPTGGSGHVAVVIHEKLHFSGQWNKDCPTVANVGHKNGFMGANYAFGKEKEPEYFVKA